MNSEQKYQILDELATLQNRMTQLKQQLAEEDVSVEPTKSGLPKLGWETVMDSFPQLICWLDAKQRIVRANRTVETWDLAQLAEVKGKDLPELLHGENREAYYNLKFQLDKDWPKLLKGQQLEYHVKTTDRDLHLAIYPIQSESVYRHELTRFITVIEDVTQQKYQEANLQQTMEELIHLNATKDKFFSIVAHDLKGSFQPFLNFTDLLVALPENVDPTRIRRMGQSVNYLARNIYNLLDNLLQWSRFQMGRITFDPNLVNLNEVIERTIELLSNKATEKKITLQHTLQEPFMAYADENMLDAVIRNLVSNAMKFTEAEGQVSISAERKPLANINITKEKYPLASHISTATAYIEVAVTDTGVGMSAEDQQKLFKIAEYHSTVGTADEQGTGLGLILCQEMVIRNGGIIWIESELGVGTTVRFTLPADNNAS